MSLLADACSNRKLASAGECDLQHNLRKNSRQSGYKITFASDVVNIDTVTHRLVLQQPISPAQISFNASLSTS